MAMMPLKPAAGFACAAPLSTLRSSMAKSRTAKTLTPAPKPEPIDPATLRLDTRNPRFAAQSGSSTKEKDIIQNLLETADLRELIDSLTANGYVDFEPLVVVEEGKGLTVIEGNRRVAAIKLLRDPDLAAELRVEIPALTDRLSKTLERAGVIKVASRDDARQYIGFKHINGPQKWDAFAKGKFAADWYRAERAKGVTLRDIARRLGDRHDTLLRLVNGIYVLEQAKKNSLFEIDDRAPGRPFFFSHLYTALTRPQYREFLGLDLQWRQADPAPNPIPAASLPKLKKVLQWIYGSESDDLEPLVKSQNPHIKQLGEVLAHPQALHRLQERPDLARAYAEVQTRSKQFQDEILKAVRHAENAQTFLEAYDGDPALLEFGHRLVKCGQTLVQVMRAATKEGNAK